MNPELASLYVESRRRTEQRLRKSNPPQEGALVETPGANLDVSTSFRTAPFLSERYKFGSPRTGESPARDVVRRRWNRTTHDMHDLRGQTEDVLAEEHRPRLPGGVVMMCKLSDWNTPAHPPAEGGVPPKTARRGGEKLQVAHRNTPICISSHSEEERRGEHSRQYKENSRFGVFRCSTPHRNAAPYGIFRWHTPSPAWLCRVCRLSDEVTL
jgi:hypothetical protein